MKIHSASAFPRQCFCRGWQDFILRASVFISATSTKTSMKSALVRLLSLLHISQRIRSIMCTIIVVQILLNAMQCALFSRQKLCFKDNFVCFVFEFKIKTNVKEWCLNRLKRNFKREIYMNNFCLMAQVLFFFGAGRWTDGKRVKQNKSCLKMWRYRIPPIRCCKTWKQRFFYCHLNEKKGWINCRKYIIDLTSCSTYRHFQVISLVCKR